MAGMVGGCFSSFSSGPPDGWFDHITPMAGCKLQEKPPIFVPCSPINGPKSMGFTRGYFNSPPKSVELIISACNWWLLCPPCGWLYLCWATPAIPGAAVAGTKSKCWNTSSWPWSLACFATRGGRNLGRSFHDRGDRCCPLSRVTTPSKWPFMAYEWEMLILSTY